MHTGDTLSGTSDSDDSPAGSRNASGDTGSGSAEDSESEPVSASKEFAPGGLAVEPLVCEPEKTLAGKKVTMPCYVEDGAVSVCNTLRGKVNVLESVRATDNLYPRLAPGFGSHHKV